MAMDRTTFAKRFAPKGKKVDKWTENQVKGRANYERLKKDEKIVRAVRKGLFKTKKK